MLAIVSGVAQSCTATLTCNSVIPEKPTKLSSAGRISGAQQDMLSTPKTVPNTPPA